MGIHKFYLNDKYIILDIASGSVHVVDKIIYDLVDDFENMTKSEIIEKYKKEYEEELIAEALDEIKILKEEGLLFS